MSGKREAGLPERVRFLYIQAPDYRIAAANGAYGGLTPQGDFLIEFYCEHQQTPVVEEHPVDDEGRLGDVSRVAEDGRVPQIERYVQFAVMMSPKQAEVLAHWVLQHLRRLGPGAAEEGDQ